jgi:hypothetical protein
MDERVTKSERMVIEDKQRTHATRVNRRACQPRSKAMMSPAGRRWGLA